ncbi:hypothetical protein M501DRAFT_436678 [Patellaria atrata CBS 101060]|uniref:PhoD-like phosphatase domain-containing protein n=1 Tax=Patellaria atrata CBS 101060 TaxID=1346257 RepID=A0A9P4S3G8_9PEZI|nr:hypothetical protein M501DRAFT_436678 [Patellaria atrata CBS 101060]
MDNQTEQKPVMVGRSNSRKLQKEPPWEYPSRKLVGGRDITKTSGSVENDHKPHDRAEHRYGVPYQLAGAYKARDSLSSSDASLEDDTSIPTDGLHKRFASIVHRKHEPERRYQHAKPLDEWKQAQIATLLANDMSLDAPETNVNQNHTDDKNKAWWERSGQQRRSSGSARQDLTGSNPTEGLIYDGAYEDPSGQTNFNPPLYMKCGPLLRYTGMRKETVARSAAAASTSEGREIWRGTVMIVTQDSASSYTAVPVLRLFVQPMDLMPPPPAQVSAESGQRLAPEYIDPLAGEVKVSRTGKTLFVRPVEDLTENTDLSRIEDDSGLFEEKRSNTHSNDSAHKLQGKQNQRLRSRIRSKDGEKLGKYKEVKGIRLYAERGVTFWRFSIEVELGSKQRRIAYRINRGPAIGFWVPAKGQTMNMMFHSCNGFSLSVDSNQFSGPDPMWRDVLNTHQTRPFHVMIGGGDQIYNDAAMKQTKLFQEWTVTKNALHKHSAQFTREMQDELEDFYLNRYAMWFSQGLFGMANSQIPMINIWDDHDIIDGFGSYPHHFMSTKVFTGLGAVAYKYYMLFQHQSLPEELQEHEPSWLLGDSPGPYINQLSRNLFMFLGRNVAFLGLDCRMERQRDSILTQATYDLVFDRLRREIIKGETRHLIVLLGVPIAYPRLNFLENVLTSRMMDPIKALGRTGLLGGFVNKFDGGVEILDDLDDHWTAKHHKSERNWFIQELQEIAAEKSVRITILGGDVHLAAVGQFFSNKKLGIPKDCDHRYMPNVISSAIVNTPPPDMMADILNKRNKIHHLDHETDEDMIPIFTHDVDGKPRNNQHLLPRRNWCSLREYEPGSTPPPSPPPQSPSPSQRGPRLSRTLSLTRKDFTPGGLVRRLSNRGAPPSSYHNSMSQDSTLAGSRPEGSRRRASADVIPRPADGSGSYFPDTTAGDIPRPNPFHRRPTGLSEKAALKGGGSNLENAGVINLEHGLDIVLNVEVNQHDPSGITTPYRLLVPALEYRGEGDLNALDYEKKGLLKSLFSHGKNKRSHDVGPSGGGFDESEEVTPAGTPHDHSIDPTHAHRETGDVLYDDYEYEPAKPKRRFSLFGSRKKREPDYDHDDRYDEGDRYTPSPPSGPPARAKTYSGPHSQPQRSASHRHSQPQAQAIAPPRRSVTMPRHQPQPHDPVPEPERHSYRSASVSRESADLHDERLERGHSRRAQQVMSERERGEREYLERVERERYSEGSLTPEPYPAPRKKKAGWRIFW